MSAHKEVSLNSILPQVSGGLQDQAKDKVAPQSSGVSVGSNVSSKLQDHASDGGGPQSSGGSVLLQVSNKCNKFIQPVCKSRKRGAVTSQSDRISQGSPPFFKITAASMLQIPKHKYVKPPPGRSPIAWSKITDNPASKASPSGNGVRPQSSGVSLGSNQQSAYKKVRFDCVSPQANGVSAHKKVSLDSILPQVSGGLQDQAKDNVAPQSSGMSAGSNVSSELQDHASDRGAPQSSGGSVLLQSSNKYNKYIQPACKSRERGAVTSQSDQTSQGSPPCSEFTSASMPRIPKHKYLKPPPGRPPIAWSKITENPTSKASPCSNGVRPQSRSVSAQSDQQGAYKNVRFDCVSPQANRVSAHKEVSLNSILPQVSGGLQDQAKDKVAPQSSGVSVGSKVRSGLKDHANDGGGP